MPTATQTGSYDVRRGEIETYFDRTAVEAWKRLTSDAPVSGIRATVRRGRDAMRETLMSWLPADLSGARLLDAGCGTGALSVEAARRGADVVAVDLSPTLVDLARERAPKDLRPGAIRFHAGDMLDPDLGAFDFAVAMDSLIHYETADVARSLEALAPRVGAAILFTFAPRTLPLAMMHAVGRAFPRSDRAPAIVPTRETTLRHALAGLPLAPARTRRVVSGFYTSQAMELVR